MPSGSEGDGDDLVFLSPDKSPPKNQDQGASPQLRRSNRKRKSVSVQDMSKGTNSSSKKKKSSPAKNAMPKVARTPPKAAEEATKEADKGDGGIAAMLLAMEERLSSKLDANKRAVNEAVKMSKLNSDAPDALEEKVDATYEILKETLARVEAQEERVLARVEEQVKEMVREQLKAAGFDSKLLAGDLTSLDNELGNGTYAEAASRTSGRGGRSTDLNKDQRREAKFWQCRRSLRIWPVPQADESGVKDFLKEKLSLSGTFIEEDMGAIRVKRSIERRPK